MNRSRWVVLLGLLILGVALWSFFTRDRSSLPAIPATVSRDCAPWDGAAFTVSIPHESGQVIYVSIWRSPDLPFPTSFTFPDDTGQVGVAYTLPELDPLQPLSGEVTFRRALKGVPLEGTFDLRAASGERFAGSFQAQWDDRVVMCG